MWNQSHRVENMYIDNIWFSPQAEKAFLDIGEIVAGGYQSVELSLVNQSPCSVSFCLSVTETVLDKNFAAGPKTVPNGTFCFYFLNDCTCCLESIFFNYMHLGHTKWINLYN